MQKRIVISINPQVLAQAKDYAKNSYDTLSHLITLALIEYLKNQQKGA